MIKARKKDIMDSFSYVVSIPYCHAQDLLSCMDTKIYTSSKYGWDADVFVVNDDVAVVTGYRPFGNVEVNHEVLERYEMLAGDAAEKHPRYRERKAAIKSILYDFLREVCKCNLFFE